MILVTGSNGFIGSHLVTYLEGKQEKVIKGVRNSDYNEDFLRGVDTIVHLAAYSKNDVNADISINVELTKSIRDIVLKVNPYIRVILASTCNVYKSSNFLMRENFTIEPRTEYEKSKLLSEEIILKLPNSKVARLSNVFGPNMGHGVLYDWKNLDKKYIVLNDKEPGSIRCFIHVDDVCDGIYRLIKTNSDKRIFNICGDWKNNTVNLKTIGTMMGIKTFFLNKSENTIIQPINELAFKELGFEPKVKLSTFLTDYTSTLSTSCL